MDYEINKAKYLTVVGHIQSGKTNAEINYCWSSIKNYHLPVIFVVRNITADQLQLRDRFNKSGLNLLVKTLKNVAIEDAVSYLEHKSVIILLCNEYHAKCARLKCGHIFHENCIKNTIVEYDKRECPLCGANSIMIW